MAADADLRGGMEEVEAGTDGLRVGAMRSIISNWRSRAAAAPPRSTGAPRSVPGFKVVCEACGGVPATCGRLTCPKCCYQASVCDKMCQRRWWRRHSTVCEVVVLPKAWTAAGGAEGLRHLVEPVLERVYELCDARSIAALGRAARWYLSASRPARRCEYGVSFAPYASAQTANVVVQPVGIARRGHPDLKAMTSRCSTVVTKRHLYVPRRSDYGHSQLLCRRAWALARTHCQTCGAKEMWRYRASLHAAPVPPGKGPGDAFRVRLAPDVYGMVRHPFYNLPLPFAPETRQGDSIASSDLARAFGDTPTPRARLETLRELFGIYGRDPSDDEWRVPPGARVGDIVEETAYRGCGATKDVRAASPGGDPPVARLKPPPGVSWHMVPVEPQLRPRLGAPPPAGQSPVPARPGAPGPRGEPGPTQPHT